MSDAQISISNVDQWLQDAAVMEEQYGHLNPMFADLREAALKQFAELRLPTTKHEEWKYFNLSLLKKEPFRLINTREIADTYTGDVERYSLHSDDAYKIYIVNGNAFHTDLKSDSLKGVKFGLMSVLNADNRVTTCFNKLGNYSNEPFVALNTAVVADPFVMLIDDNITINKPVELIFIASADEDYSIINTRLLVVAGVNAVAEITETFRSANTNKVFINHLTEIVAEKNSRISYNKVQDESDQTIHIGFHQLKQESDSVVKTNTFTFGGGMVRNNLHILLNGKGCQSYLNGLYVADGKQVIDNHTLVDHALPNCYSNELYKGILADHSSGVFNGKIFVRKDAQKTNAYQSNKNILLSNDASMNAKPQLEIFADDVKCSHGATTGQLDHEALFYLRSRGITAQTAETMLNHAFAADVISQTGNKHLEEMLLQMLTGKLN